MKNENKIKKTDQNNRKHQTRSILCILLNKCKDKICTQRS